MDIMPIGVGGYGVRKVTTKYSVDQDRLDVEEASRRARNQVLGTDLGVPGKWVGDPVRQPGHKPQLGFSKYSYDQALLERIQGGYDDSTDRHWRRRVQWRR